MFWMTRTFIRLFISKHFSLFMQTSKFRHFNWYSVIILIFRISIKFRILAYYSIDNCYLNTLLRFFVIIVNNPHSKFCQIKSLVWQFWLMKLDRFWILAKFWRHWIPTAQVHGIWFILNLWDSQSLYCLGWFSFCNHNTMHLISISFHWIVR